MVDKPEQTKDIAFFRFPLIEGNIPVAEIGAAEGYVITAASSFKEEGEKLLAFLGSKESQEVLSRRLNRPVARIDIDTSHLQGYQKD